MEITMSKETINEIVDFCEKHYKPGEYVYTDAIRRNIDCSPEDVSAAMKELESCGKAKTLYSIICPHCGCHAGMHYADTIDIPDEMYCVRCDNMIEPFSSNIVELYKIIA